PGLERRAVAWWARKASLVVSSLRGPETRLHLTGHTVRSMVVWAPAPASIALSLSLFGYAGEMRLGVLADAGVITDPEALAAAVDQTLDEIVRIVDRPVVLVGSSLGGALALRYATRRPERVAALALVSPAGARLADHEWEDLLGAFRIESAAEARRLVARLY